MGSIYCYILYAKFYNDILNRKYFSLAFQRAFMAELKNYTVHRLS